MEKRKIQPGFVYAYGFKDEFFSSYFVFCVIVDSHVRCFKIGHDERVFQYSKIVKIQYDTLLEEVSCIR